MKSFVKKIFSTIFLTLILALSLGIYFFDIRLITFRKVALNTTFIYWNQTSLGLLLKLVLITFAVLSLLISFLSFVLKSKKGINYWDCLIRELFCLLPLCFLVFSRFVYGKAIKYIFYIPLYPMFIILILVMVIHFHLVLYFNLNVFLRIFQFLKTPNQTRRYIFRLAMVFFLMTILVNLVVDSPRYNRYTGYKLFGGDEPKYVRMAYSLVTDGDLDIVDEFYLEEDLDTILEKILSSGLREFGTASVIGKDGKKVYPLHMPGLAFLMLPGFIVDVAVFPQTRDKSDLYEYYNFGFLPQKLTFTRAWLFIISILMFVLLARLAHRFFHSLLIPALLLFLLIISSPLPDFMFQLYPEVAGAFFSLIALNAIVFPFKKKWINHVLIMLGIGFLPWLHQRFFILALSLYIVYIIYELLFRKNIKKVLTTSFLLFLTSLPYFYYFFTITGNPLPTSIHKFYGSTFTRFGIFPLGFFGHLFDYAVGIIWLFPWTLFALLGIYWGLKEDRKEALLLVITLIPYYLMTCFHIAWHGMVEEPGRYLVAIFPILLLLLGFTVKAFFKHKSYHQLFFYALLLILIFLNRLFRFINYDFHGPFVVPEQVPILIKSGLMLIVVFLSVFMIDRFTGEKVWKISFHSAVHTLKTMFERIRFSGVFRKIQKSVLILPFVILVGYLILFCTSWKTKALSLPLFASFDKIHRTDNVSLFQEMNQEPQFQKGDKNFLEFFTSEYHFKVDSERVWQKKIERGIFWEKLPRGCYRVNVETEDLLPQDSLVYLDFLGDESRLNMREVSGKSEGSVTFFLFDDQYAKKDMRLRFESPEAAGISGKIQFFPLPSVVFENELIIRPVPIRNPKFIRQEGDNQYRFTFTATTRKKKQEFMFLLHMIRGLNRSNFNEESPIDTLTYKFDKQISPYRIDMDISLKQNLVNTRSRFVFLVNDKKTHLINCQSMAFVTTKDFWLLPAEQENY